MTKWRHYWRPQTGSLVTAIAFAWAGIEPEAILVEKKSSQHEPDFLALNPAAQVPVAIMPCGTVLAETAAIVLAIDEARPGAGLLPPAGSSERGTALRWLMFLAVAGYPAALRYYYADRFTADASEAGIEAVRAAASRESDRIFAIVAGAMRGPFLFGETPTIVDAYAAMLADWHEPAQDLPVFRTLRQAILAHPVIGETWRRHEQSSE
ncbi:glutathione S-transferase [Labrys miyagiensis]|uniref:Glutathione S-transferase n=1 Tax=Labrys miyagiensis TaxID=346912 RepID=A0ABQ6CBI5_9HYPH|nr:glutathione S-transferase family protein [Labrys miyagiensis]GLS17747.1 glutathione S-transferase [Labrys miyagiensis]